MSQQYEVWRGSHHLVTTDASRLKSLTRSGHVLADDIIRTNGHTMRAGKLPQLHRFFPGQPRIETLPRTSSLDSNRLLAPIRWGLRLTGAFCILFAVADLVLHRTGTHHLWLAVDFVSNTVLTSGIAVAIGLFGGLLLSLSGKPSSPLAIPVLAGGLLASLLLAFVGLLSVIVLQLGLEEIRVVKSGYFEQNRDSDVGTLLRRRFSTVSWDVVSTPDLGEFVETRCQDPRHGSLILQWKVEGETFELIHALMDDQPLKLAGTIDWMCEPGRGSDLPVTDLRVPPPLPFDESAAQIPGTYVRMDPTLGVVINKNSLPAGMSVQSSAITEADGLDIPAKQSGSVNTSLRVDRLYQLEGTKLVKLDVSRGKSPVDIWGDVRREVGEDAPLVLVDSTGMTYTPIGWLHRKASDGLINVKLDPRTGVPTVGNVPMLSSSGKDNLDLLFSIPVGRKIVAVKLGDVTLGTVDLEITN